MFTRLLRSLKALLLYLKQTVGGTENVMMAAALAVGAYYIRKYKEPEIVDLAEYLITMKNISMEQALFVLEGE